MARHTISLEVCTDQDLTSVHLVMFSLFCMMWPTTPGERAGRSAMRAGHCETGPGLARGL